MEKRTPHCKLSIVKALTEAGKVRMTASAVAGAEALGLDRADVFDVVLALSAADFFKSRFKNNAIHQRCNHTDLVGRSALHTQLAPLLNAAEEVASTAD